MMLKESKLMKFITSVLLRYHISTILELEDHSKIVFQEVKKGFKILHHLITFKKNH